MIRMIRMIRIYANICEYDRLYSNHSNIFESNMEKSIRMIRMIRIIRIYSISYLFEYIRYEYEDFPYSNIFEYIRIIRIIRNIFESATMLSTQNLLTGAYLPSVLAHLTKLRFKV